VPLAFLLLVDYAFHTTAIAAAGIVVIFFLRLLGERRAISRDASGRDLASAPAQRIEMPILRIEHRVGDHEAWKRSGFAMGPLARLPERWSAARHIGVSAIEIPAPMRPMPCSKTRVST
jgi:hypothetical protein